MPTVTFKPDNIAIDVVEGENLLRAAMMADVRVTATCGGDGTCGKCRMLVAQGRVDTKPSACLTERQEVEGWVLACGTDVLDDLTVNVPLESRPGAAPVAERSGRMLNRVLSADARAARVPAKRSTLPVCKMRVEVREPNHADNASDVGRVRQALERGHHHLQGVEFTLPAIRRLPRALREGEWTVTAVVTESESGRSRVTGFEPGDTTERQYAVAVDVGTTTVEVALIDLRSRRTVAQAAEYNAQIDLGDDVITRIIASTCPDGLRDLQSRVVETISALVTRVLAEAGVSADDLVLYIAAANTVMTHLLLGVTPEPIRTAPYVPAASFFPVVDAADVGLPGTRATQLMTIDCPASWLGGDVVAGVVAAGIPWSDKLTLYVDIGTNGEIVLGSTDFLVACSCSAGPAFEGGGMTHGMRAADGAIEQVRIDCETLEPSVLAIGGAKPLGICGSGLIDCASELFLCGAVDRSGRFDKSVSSAHVRTGDRGTEYVLVSAEESATGADIVVTEGDIENLMRAKAAMFAGISVLVESLDLALDDVEEIIVAGGFGHYLDLERAAVLGMLPELPPERFVFLGNGSLSGATLAVTSRLMLDKTVDTASAMTYLELSVNAAFMEAYVSSLFLPHTNLSLFPNAEALLAQRRSQKAAH